MTGDLSRAERALVATLFAAGGTMLLKDVLPRPKGTPHRTLATRKLLTTQKAGRTLRLELADAGWRWIEDNELFPIAQGEKRVTAERRVLFMLMATLKARARRKGSLLNAFFRDEQVVTHAPERKDATLDQRIREAFYAIAGGPPANGNIRISLLRAKLADISRSDLDATLLTMWRAGRATLTNLNNPRDIAAERATAVRNGPQAFELVSIVE